MTSEELDLLGESELSLLETLDHVLNLGLVIAGEITISVANIELIFVGLNLLVGSTETVHKVLGKRVDRLQAMEKATGDAANG